MGYFAHAQTVETRPLFGGGGGGGGGKWPGDEASTLYTYYMCFSKNSDCNNINIQLALLQTVIKYLC